LPSVIASLLAYRIATGILNAFGVAPMATAEPLPFAERTSQAFSTNFWNVWQFSGTCPRLAANVHVTSLT
jgi:hypothetical protein